MRYRPTLWYCNLACINLDTNILITWLLALPFNIEHRYLLQLTYIALWFVSDSRRHVHCSIGGPNTPFRHSLPPSMSILCHKQPLLQYYLTSVGARLRTGLPADLRLKLIFGHFQHKMSVERCQQPWIHFISGADSIYHGKGRVYVESK